MGLENPRVGSSILSLGTILFLYFNWLYIHKDSKKCSLSVPRAESPLFHLIYQVTVSRNSRSQLRDTYIRLRILLRMENFERKLGDKYRPSDFRHGIFFRFFVPIFKTIFVSTKYAPVRL